MPLLHVYIIALQTADIILSRLEEKPDIVVDVRLREKVYTGPCMYMYVSSIVLS